MVVLAGADPGVGLRREPVRLKPRENLLQPTAGVAGTLSVAITDTSRIAAAAPIKAAAGLGNTVSPGLTLGITPGDPQSVSLSPLPPASVPLSATGSTTASHASQ